MNGSRTPLSEAERARRAELAAQAAIGKSTGVPAAASTTPGSSTDVPKTYEPAVFIEETPVDTWVADKHGAVRWRPVFDRIDVIALPNDERLLVVGGIRIKLPAAVADHLGDLLKNCV